MNCGKSDVWVEPRDLKVGDEFETHSNDYKVVGLGPSYVRARNLRSGSPVTWYFDGLDPKVKLLDPERIRRGYTTMDCPPTAGDSRFVVVKKRGCHQYWDGEAWVTRKSEAKRYESRLVAFKDMCVIADDNENHGGVYLSDLVISTTTLRWM